MPTAPAAPSRVGTRLTLNCSPARLFPRARCVIIDGVMPSTVYIRTLHKAAELMGGRKALARHLRVPLADLERWMSGVEVPPMATFLLAVDVVLEGT